MHVDSTAVEIFISQKFKHTTALQHLADGWWSQAFSFNCDKGKMVIRISPLLKDFLKDAYAFRQLNSVLIPIPAIFETGRFNDQFYYCLSSYCEGTPADRGMAALDTTQKNTAADALTATLHHIHQLDASSHKGWGLTNETGHGGWPSWGAFLMAVYNHKNPVSWQELQKTSWLDGDLFEKLLQRMETLLPCLPEQKSILHGDYGYDNVLINEQLQVTAVLDWGEMLLGDALYDLVHMNEPWTTPEISYLPRWLQLQENAGSRQRYVTERLTCYQLHYTLMHLHICTSHGKEEDYREVAQWARQHLL